MIDTGGKEELAVLMSKIRWNSLQRWWFSWSLVLIQFEFVVEADSSGKDIWTWVSGCFAEKTVSKAKENKSFITVAKCLDIMSLGGTFILYDSFYMAYHTHKYVTYYMQTMSDQESQENLIIYHWPVSLAKLWGLEATPVHLIRYSLSKKANQIICNGEYLCWSPEGL